MNSEAQAQAKPKPPIMAYLVVAGLLTVLTAMEISVAYIPALRSVLVPVLLIISGAKFALVVMFYMHLRYDSYAYSVVFLPLMLLALVVTGALLTLMATFFGRL